jgi:Ser/Thr protein kinase RdoA (MazF antagonist)
MNDDAIAAEILRQTWGLDEGRLQLLAQGLINATWRVDLPDARRFALQRVNPVFPAAVNGDIHRVTAQLQANGLTTPLLVATPAGEYWLESDNGTWRLMTWVDGVSRDSLATADQASAAGALLGRFHRALDDMPHQFANPRLGVHDTARHLRQLREALAEHSDHADFARVEILAKEILALAARLPEVPATPDRVVHGDPKINNMLFDAVSGDGIALVDLDTVGCMPLPLELGDALRSWCNPAGENDRSGVFSPELFAAALQGYADSAGDWITDQERAAVLPATLTIILELAARFCADALNENYFGWDAQRFASRGEHNQLRAAGQLTLALSCERQYAALEQLARAALN